MSSSKHYNTRGNNSNVDQIQKIPDGNINTKKRGRPARNTSSDETDCFQTQQVMSGLPAKRQAAPGDLLVARKTDNTVSLKDNSNRVPTETQPPPKDVQRKVQESKEKEETTLLVEEKTLLVPPYQPPYQSPYSLYPVPFQPPLPFYPTPMQPPLPSHPQRENSSSHEGFSVQQTWSPYTPMNYTPYQAPYFPLHQPGFQQSFMQMYPSYQPPWFAQQLPLVSNNFNQASQLPHEEVQVVKKKKVADKIQTLNEDAGVLNNIISDGLDVLQKRVNNFIRGKGKKYPKGETKKAEVANTPVTHHNGCYGNIGQKTGVNSNRSNYGNCLNNRRENGYGNGFRHDFGYDVGNAYGNGYGRGSRGGRGKEHGKGRGNGRYN